MTKPNDNDNDQNANQETDGGGTDFEALYKQAQEDLKKAQEDAAHWKDMSRKNEDRAKANYGAAKDLEEANAQMAQLAQRLEAIEGENSALKANAARAAMVKKVAGETGVPEAIVATLAADDEDALTKAATAIAEAYKTAGGGPHNDAGGKFHRDNQASGGDWLRDALSNK